MLGNILEGLKMLQHLRTTLKNVSDCSYHRCHCILGVLQQMKILSFQNDYFVSHLYLSAFLHCFSIIHLFIKGR